MSGEQDEGYYVEFIQVGNLTKVIAIDPVTGLEVIMVGDPARSQDILAREAVKKLKYVLSKQK